MPAFSVTVNAALAPGWISFVLSEVPLIARSCGIFPTFLASKVIFPALKVVVPVVILNSVSSTATAPPCGAAGVVPGAATASCFFDSAPKVSTAASIPKKNTKATTMNASSPRPG